MVMKDSKHTLSEPEHDTEDKQYWTAKYFQKEVEFCERVCPQLGLDGRINPEKAKDPTKPDLIINGNLADLKYQSTPSTALGQNTGVTRSLLLLSTSRTIGTMIGTTQILTFTIG